jgi:ABC-type phosphate/phosphonate transport system substrate-binding protein
MSHPNGWIASLPMYDFPELRAHTELFWTSVKDECAKRGLTHAPPTLSRAHDLATFWQDPQLIFAQTCGYPLKTWLRGRLRYVATPIYHAEGCQGPEHCSVVIVRRGSAITSLTESFGTIVAVNQPDSNTGMNLLRLLLARSGARGKLFDDVIMTGSHRQSISAVASGQAAFAAIDCVSFALLEQSDPDLISQVSVIDRTPSTPSLPFVTSLQTSDDDIAILRGALVAAIKALPQATKAALMLDAITVLDENDYDRVLAYEDEAAQLGYAQLQ